MVTRGAAKRAAQLEALRQHEHVLNDNVVTMAEFNAEKKSIQKSKEFKINLNLTEEELGVFIRIRVM